jgi:hypothetical protein
MPTILDKPLIRDTGLTRNEKSVFVVMLPSSEGGTIAFKEKGKHGKGIEISLSRIMGIAFGDAEKAEKADKVEKTEQKEKKFVTVEGTTDLVDLGTLEARLMIDGQGVMTPEIKGRICDIVREIREERREELGMPPVYRGTKAQRHRENVERDEAVQESRAVKEEVRESEPSTNEV